LLETEQLLNSYNSRRALHTRHLRGRNRRYTGPCNAPNNIFWMVQGRLLWQGAGR